MLFQVAHCSEHAISVTGAAFLLVLGWFPDRSVSSYASSSSQMIDIDGTKEGGKIKEDKMGAGERPLMDLILPGAQMSDSHCIVF